MTTTNTKDSGLSIATNSSNTDHSNNKIVELTLAKATPLAIADESDYGHHHMLFLSPELDAAVTSILAVKTPLDAPILPVVDYMNKIFPSGNANVLEQVGFAFMSRYPGQSLAQADKALLKLRTQIKAIDKEVGTIMRSQTEESKEVNAEIQQVNRAMEEMVARIKTIKEKANESEKMVMDITRDIKNLDQGKRNLTLSITVLRRLQMLVSAMEQLRGMASRKQYTEVAQLLQVVLQLLVHFKAYKDVKQISSLFEAMKQFQRELKVSILTEFEASFNSGLIRVQTKVLNDACLVLEILEVDGDSKDELIEWYCNMQLKEYRSVFRANPEVTGLDAISRRYAWLKRILKNFDEEHVDIFPATWRVAERLCERFCLDTKKDLSDVCQKTDSTMDVKVLVQAIQQTMEFEEKLEKRFPPKASREDSEAHLKSKFSRIISSCYEPYLKHYIDLQDKTLSNMFDNYRLKSLVQEDDTILSSSTDMFYYYRQTFGSFFHFTTRKPFVDLCTVFSKWLRIYAEYLISKVPKDDKRAITEDDLKVICLVCNTSEYCANTVSQLEEKVIETVDEEFKSHVTFAADRDVFMSASGASLQGLVRGVESILENCITSMMRRSWSSIESVGDQSEHVTQIAVTLSNVLTKIRRYLTSDRIFKSFCDKFAESFLNKYYTAIFKCRPMSEVGAEQMLLDTSSLKSILTKMVDIGSDGSSKPSSMYQKIVAKGTGKIEQLLKVVIRSHDPPEVIVDTFRMIYNNDQSIANFQKILELKGLKRSEQVSIVEVFQRRGNGAVPSVPADTTKSPTQASFPEKTATASSHPGTTSATGTVTSMAGANEAMAQAGKKLTADFKKLMGGMGTIKRS